jgi:hypothetical protein
MEPMNPTNMDCMSQQTFKMSKSKSFLSNTIFYLCGLHFAFLRLYEKKLGLAWLLFKTDYLMHF